MSSFQNDATSQYAKDVVTGAIVAGEFVRLACQRHLDDLKDGHENGLFWDIECANKALRFFPAVLTISGGEVVGQPFELLPWHVFVVGSIFGWKDKNKLRRFRFCWIETGKGQAKSPLMAAIGLYLAGFCGIKKAEVYCIGEDRRTANVMFKDAVTMVRAHIPDRRGETLVGNGQFRIWGKGSGAYKLEHVASGSTIEPLANNDSASGPKPIAVLGDEIHEMKKSDSITTWKAAIDKMSGDPLMILGTNTPALDQVVGTKYSEFFQNVLKGTLKDNTAFAYIARTDKGDDPFTDESCWIKSLPALGITFPVENVRNKLKQAEGLPSEYISIQRLFFGIPVGSDGFWISEAAWNEVLGDINEAEMIGKNLHLSLDLSEKNDLTALSGCWEGDILTVKTWYWTRSFELKQRSSTENIPYAELAHENCIEITDGRIIDYTFVVKQINILCQKHNVAQMAVDSSRLERLLLEMRRSGFDYWIYDGPETKVGDGLKIVRHKQGQNVSFDGKFLCMPTSISELEDRILNGKIIIEKNRLTDICASNAVISADGMGNKMFDKNKSRSKIDGMVTIAMAVGSAEAEMRAKNVICAAEVAFVL